MVQLNFGRKKIFFAVLYRSPALDFLSNFINLYSNIKNENPYASFFIGDFNPYASFLLGTLMDTQNFGGLMVTTAEGREIENLLSSLCLCQFISESTNFVPNKNPFCIDPVITGQPNLVLYRRTRASLDSFCHHQVPALSTSCKVNFNTCY